MSKIKNAGYGGYNPHQTNYWYVYILKLNNNKLYTGCTSNLSNRICEHLKGNVNSTKKYMPAELISFTAFIDKTKAFEYEKYLKSGSGRAFRKRHLL